jgi:CspA family cold shock protein
MAGGLPLLIGRGAKSPIKPRYPDNSSVLDDLACQTSTDHNFVGALANLCLEQVMPRGTVKWFNPTKGYGFIQPTGGGGKDVFVHITAVERAGFSTLNEGQVVEYEEVSNRGRTAAENLRLSR